MRQVLEKEPVGDDARAACGSAAVRKLACAVQVIAGPDGLRGLELGQVRDEVPAERGDIDDEEFFRGGHAGRFRRGDE